jgi:hypothetical protein
MPIHLRGGFCLNCSGRLPWENRRGGKRWRLVWTPFATTPEPTKFGRSHGLIPRRGTAPTFSAHTSLSQRRPVARGVKGPAGLELSCSQSSWPKPSAIQLRPLA